MKNHDTSIAHWPPKLGETALAVNLLKIRRKIKK